jgi:hypothetical protein
MAGRAYHRRVTGFRLALLAMLVPAAVLLAPAAAGAAGPDVPQPGTASTLDGDWCTSPSNCWAVGYYKTVSGAQLNQVLRWPGTEWSLFPVPQPGGTGSGDVNSLGGVTCTSASNCWAVGRYDMGGASRNEALRWNGTTWFLVPTPQPSATTGLGDVSCTSAGNCWAIGGFTNAKGAELNEALHWNGSKWARVATPQPAGTGSVASQNILSDVACASARNCWAAGFYTTPNMAQLNQALHWNGTKWSLVSTPQPSGTTSSGVNNLYGVTCTSAGNCWAVGSYNSSSAFLNEALSWDGSTWSLVSTPQPDASSNVLRSVTCTASANCWAVGDFATNPILNEALHWDGATWSLVATPDVDQAPGELNDLIGVRCGSSASCWAVGYTEAGVPTLNQALYWNGSTWSIG